MENNNFSSKVNSWSSTMTFNYSWETDEFWKINLIQNTRWGIEKMYFWSITGFCIKNDTIWEFCRVLKVLMVKTYFHDYFIESRKTKTFQEKVISTDSCENQLPKVGPVSLDLSYG